MIQVAARIIGIALFIMTFAYFIFAFVTLNANPLEWAMHNRILFSVCAICSLPIALLIEDINSESRRNRPKSR